MFKLFYRIFNRKIIKRIKKNRESVLKTMLAEMYRKGAIHEKCKF